MIKFTGDRTTDRIMNQWYDWYSTKRNKHADTIESYDDKQLDELMYRVGMEDFVSFVLEEFPSMEDVGSEYDVPSTWDMFLDYTKVGYDVEEALSEMLEDYIVDVTLLNEYIDDDVIAETYLDGMLDTFFEENSIGKKLKIADRKALERAFSEGTCEEFTNGFSFCPSEYIACIMAEGDDDDNDYASMHKYYDSNDEKSKKNGILLMDGYISNPHLYNGDDIYCMWEIYIEDIAKHADLKQNGKKKNDNNEMDIPF